MLSSPMMHILEVGKTILRAGTNLNEVVDSGRDSGFRPANEDPRLSNFGSPLGTNELQPDVTCLS